MELDNYYKLTIEEITDCILTEEDMKKYLLSNEKIENILEEIKE